MLSRARTHAVACAALTARQGATDDTDFARRPAPTFTYPGASRSRPPQRRLLGFSDFERSALAMQFAPRERAQPGYALVGHAAASATSWWSTPTPNRLLRSRARRRPRRRRAVRRRGGAPAGALARLKRPIDALSLLRELDAAVLRVQGPAAAVLAAAPAKPAMAPTAAPIAVPPKPAIPLQRRTLPLARPPQSAGEPGGTVPGLLDSQLSELADLFPDRAPANGDASHAPAKEIRCDALLVDDSEIALRFLESKLGELGLRIAHCHRQRRARSNSWPSTVRVRLPRRRTRHGQSHWTAWRCAGTSSARAAARTGRAPVVAMVSAHATQPIACAAASRAATPTSASRCDGRRAARGRGACGTAALTARITTAPALLPQRASTRGAPRSARRRRQRAAVKRAGAEQPRPTRWRTAPR